MNDTTKQADIRDARTPEDALKIARARISDLSDEYARKADAAAWEGDMQLHESHAGNTTGLEKAWMLLGDLLHELNEASDTAQQATTDTPQKPATDRFEYYEDTITEGCVIAIDPTTAGADGLHEGYAADFNHANSGVAWYPVTLDVLGERLTVEEAKEIHPRLFKRIRNCSTAPTSAVSK